MSMFPVARTSIILSALCAGLFPAAQAGAQPRLAFDEYKALCDGQGLGYRANAAGAVLVDGMLDLVFTGALDDDEAGTMPFETVSRDMGRTWSPPARFGSELFSKLIQSPRDEFLSLTLLGATRRQTLLAIGYHVRKGAHKETYQEDVRWRPSSVLIGRKAKGQDAFRYRDYPPGSFLGEQFASSGIVMANGRIVATLWGAAHQGENWQCGVLLSDDDGATWHFRQVAYEPDPAIRDDPKTPAGYNEQTIFETKDGQLISMIRGREKLGRVPKSPKDTWFFRSVSTDRGETWSKPEPSNLAGTGAPAGGLTLPDGSLLMVTRVPFSRTFYHLNERGLFGLNVVRSRDGGKTWRSERIFQRDPDRKPFDNYYNAMNGQFLQVGENQWIYLFGQFSLRRDQHRILMFRFSFEE